MRERGTCDAWACDKPAVGHRTNGYSTVNLCVDHLPAEAMDDEGPETETVCGVCVKPKKPDITGELRCAQCDDAIDSMVADWREEAIEAGEMD